MSDPKYVAYAETKCWIEGVYLEPSLFNYTEQEAIAVGVGSPIYRDSNLKKHPELIYHTYYQWVIPVLALQAFLLYLPRALWRTWENGVIVKILKNSGEWTNHSQRFEVNCWMFHRFPDTQRRVEEAARYDLEVLPTQQRLPSALLHQVLGLRDHRLLRVGEFDEFSRDHFRISHVFPSSSSI
jgi:hypothetical protein